VTAVAEVESAATTERLRLFGRVAADETGLYRVNIGIDGVIREVAAVTTGHRVEKGQWLATISAPESRGPIQTYLVARDVLGRANPTVGLLNIGEEDEKGNAVVKEAHQLLKQTPGIHYIGNIEGREIPVGEARGKRLDVVVCDGFVGNVVLKFYESAGRLFVSLIKREAPDVLQRPEMAKVLSVLDYATYGGAPLLGVQGVVIICHGASPANAIKNAIRVAAQAVRSHLSDDIAAEFSEGKVPARSGPSPSCGAPAAIRRRAS